MDKFNSTMELGHRPFILGKLLSLSGAAMLILCANFVLAKESQAIAGVALDKNMPMHIRADSVITDISNQTIKYHDNIQLEFGSIVLSAKTLDYSLGDEGEIFITGSPVVVLLARKKDLPDIEIRATQVRMQKPYQKIEFFQDVRVNDGEHRLAARTLILDVTNKIYTGEDIHIVISDIDKLSGKDASKNNVSDKDK